ncbi:IclR family transcriptional regulator [Aureimonas sp. SA4125]|uniref:IclR family transcriptional regulator n=1 Tax=Aureimonas sp. SA4125 TaxID=2826993 RepID=UPI001CC58798|nr:IclR family transcriptional regulator [Aureimonas sp. SA4125]BDA85419.1 IclR family transcriptional regulator [Aureimonas sp. SA4125]
MADAATESGVVKAGGGRSRGLDRAFDILDFLAGARRAMRPNEIAQELGAPRSTVYDLTALLVRRGFLEEVGDGRLFLGDRLHILGAAHAALSSRQMAIEAALGRIVEDTQETAQFCRLDGNKYIVATARDGTRPFRITTNIGHRVPLTWTASGRLLVGHLDAAGIAAFVPPEDFALPDGRPIDRNAFLAEVEAARVVGHFTFDSALDSYTHCFAVPVRSALGRAEATLCIVAPREDAYRNHAAYLASLKQAAAQISPLFAKPG